MQDTLQKFSIDGYDISYEERGQGAPVLLVHGSTSDHRTWDAQIEAFGESCRAIAYSRRFQWPNAPIADGAPYAMDEQLDDLSAIVREIGDGPVHVVGNSYGGYLCLLLAMREPETVRTLTLEQPPVIPLFANIPPSPLQLLKVLATRPRIGFEIVRMATTGLAPASKAAERNNVDEATRIFDTAVLGKAFYDRMSPEQRQQSRDNFIREEVINPDFLPLDREAIQRIEIPVLLVDGAESPRLFQLLTDELQELVPHAERASIPDASHLAHNDNADAFNEAVRSFLDRH